MDYTFLLEDNTYLHLEFQTTNKKEDLSRFLAYDALLHYKEGKKVKTIVVYSSNIKKATTSIDAGSIKYEVKGFYMYGIDGDEKYEKLKKKVANDEELDRQDILSLTFLPLMKSEKEKNERVLEAIELAKRVKHEEEKNNCLALLYAFAEKFIDSEYMEKVKEAFRMTEIGKMLRDEAYEEGKKEGLCNSQNMIIELLENKFDDIDVETLKMIKKIDDFDVLNLVMKKALKVDSIQKLKEYLKKL